MAELMDFMISRVRQKLYGIFFSNPQEMFYVRQLTRMTREEINAVRRELERMETNKVIKKEKRGNRLYYFVRDDYDYYEDLLSMVVKSTGLGLELRENRHKLGKLRMAMMSGKYVRSIKRDESDVDLLIVGEVDLELLAKFVKEEEERKKTEINYTVMSQEEFLFRKRRRDPFLQNILLQSRCMILGDQEFLVNKPAE